MVFTAHLVGVCFLHVHECTDLLLTWSLSVRENEDETNKTQIVQKNLFFFSTFLRLNSCVFYFTFNSHKLFFARLVFGGSILNSFHCLHTNRNDIQVIFNRNAHHCATRLLYAILNSHANERDDDDEAKHKNCTTEWCENAHYFTDAFVNLCAYVCVFAFLALVFVLVDCLDCFCIRVSKEFLFLFHLASIEQRWVS